MSRAPEPELRLERLLWAGPLTVLSSVVTVAFVRMIAIVIVQPDARFFSLMSALPMTDTAIFASAAVLVFKKFGRCNAEPIPEYRRLAAWVLVVSLVVVVWAICVTLLPALVAARNT